MRKINGLLEQFGLKDRDIHGASAEEILDVFLNQPIDWNERGKELTRQREVSRNYLKNSFS